MNGRQKVDISGFSSHLAHELCCMILGDANLAFCQTIYG